MVLSVSVINGDSDALLGSETQSVRDRATKHAAVESYIQVLTPLLRVWIAAVQDGGFD